MKTYFSFLFLILYFNLYSQSGLVSGNYSVSIIPVNNGDGTFNISGSFSDPKGQYFASDVDTGMVFWKGNHFYLIDSIISVTGPVLDIRVQDTYSTGFIPSGVAQIVELTPNLSLPGVSTTGDSNPALATPPDYAALMNYLILRIDNIITLSGVDLDSLSDVRLNGPNLELELISGEIFSADLSPIDTSAWRTIGGDKQNDESGFAYRTGNTTIGVIDSNTHQLRVDGSFQFNPESGFTFDFQEGSGILGPLTHKSLVLTSDLDNLSGSWPPSDGANFSFFKNSTASDRDMLGSISFLGRDNLGNLYNAAGIDVFADGNWFNGIGLGTSVNIWATNPSETFARNVATFQGDGRLELDRYPSFDDGEPYSLTGFSLDGLDLTRHIIDGSAQNGDVLSFNTISSHFDWDTRLSNLVNLSGVAANAPHLGTFPGSFIRDNATIYEALADIEALIDTTLTLDVGNLGQVLTEGNDAQGIRIINAGDPVGLQDLVTLNYFNNNIATDWKQPLAILQAADNHQFKIDTNSIELLGDLVFMAGDRRIILDITGRDTFFLANNQFLYLDLSAPISISGDDYTYNESSLDLGFGGVQEEDLVLFSYSEDPPKNIDKYSGILSRGFDRLEIQRASEAKLQMRYVPGRVEFTLDGSSAIINNYLELGYRDRKVIRLIWDTYPAIITLSSDVVYCLDLEANYVEDSRTRTYNASEALITILDQAMTNPNLQIPLLGEGIQNSNQIGSGLIWETYGQKDQEEKLKLRGDMMAVQALPVSESENLLAHDHHIFMVYDPVTDKTYQITTYQRNNVVTTEINENQVVIGRVYDAYSGELLVDTILLAANTVYANITTENERCGHPHSWQLNSDTVRTVLNNGIGLYKTDFAFSSVSWSNLDFFQCDFGAGQVDVDTAAVKTYLRSLGLSSAVVNPHNKLRMRNADQIQAKTDTAWYAFIETYEEPSADPGTTGISILIVSNDQGATWQARGTPYNPAIYPNGYAESALVQLNDTLYAVSRGSGNYVLSKSSDFGWTWTTPVTISGLGLGTSASAHKYIDTETSEEWAILAYNADNELTGHRTRLVISKTQDFDTFYTMAIYDAIEGAHYPSLDLFGGYGYIQWTTGFKINYTDTFDYDVSSNGRDAIMASKFPLRWFYEALR
jgi:hypothetical protein